MYVPIIHMLELANEVITDCMKQDSLIINPLELGLYHLSMSLERTHAEVTIPRALICFFLSIQNLKGDSKLQNVKICRHPRHLDHWEDIGYIDIAVLLQSTAQASSCRTSGICVSWQR